MKRFQVTRTYVLILSLVVLLGGFPLRVWSSGARVIEEVVAGGQHTCILHQNGTIWCWGSNRFGTLGNGTTRDSSTPVKVSGIQTAQKVVAGGLHTCALLDTGSVWCWGLNTHGKLGTGLPDEEDKTVLRPTQVKGLPSVIDLDTALGHTCALVKDKSVWCWGVGKRGELGDGRLKSSITPVQVQGIDSATAIVTGDYHSCALLKGGEVWCWGGNVFVEPTSVPRRKTDLPKAIALGAGGGHTCVVLSDRTVQCWGQNFAGQLGNGTDANNIFPSLVKNLSNVVSVDLGNAHSCALLLKGQMRCWGGNYVGQLGNGAPKIGREYDSTVPVEVQGGHKFRLMAAGSDHTCGLGIDEVMRCWGENFDSQFSPRKGVSFSTPQEIFLRLD